MEIETRLTPFGWMARRGGILYGPFSSEKDMHTANAVAASVVSKIESIPSHSIRRKSSAKRFFREASNATERRLNASQAKLQIMWDAV